MIYIPNIAIKLIKKYEGYSNKVYFCPAGYKTIGYGHLIKPGEIFDRSILPQEAENLLLIDLQFYSKAIYSLVNAKLNEMQFAALLSFTFNLGSAALERSTLRQKLNRFEYLSAADEFPKWVFASGIKLAGLVKRREEERIIFLA